MSIRLLLVDDHPIVADGVRLAIEGHRDIELQAVARTLAEARKALAESTFDVVLLDLRLPDGDGATLLVEIDTLPVPPRVVVFSSFETSQYIDAALRLGASGFLLKTEPIERIVGTIRDAAEGRLAFTAEQLHRAGHDGWIPLTPRERSVIELVLAGHSNDEIGLALRLTGKTVETYLSRLFERLNVVSRVELAVRAERGQWLALPATRSGRAIRDQPATGQPPRR